ncbi:MAG: HD domain-containing protein, partial [Candidatus Thorarchaeota archaeon]
MAELIRLTGFREQTIADAKSAKGAAWDEIQSKIKRRRRLWSVEEKHTRQKAIQDPVHGAIIFAPWELDILSSIEMLRLRFVKQLGPAHLVYPGATHTRFLHCVGTSFLAQKCIRVVNYCDDLDEPCFYPLSNLLDDYQQKVFRAAALLHDVGHPPTSHTIEYALESWAGIDHLDLGEYLIKHSGLSDILKENGIEPSIVVDVFRRKAKDPVWMLLSDFLDHPLDIDKTDYLIRDAHFSGVQLGIFPAERVMLTNRVVKNRDGNYVRAFMLKALHSLESLILSRNWMFSDLYLHHAVKLAEAITSKATY